MTKIGKLSTLSVKDLFLAKAKEKRADIKEAIDKLLKQYAKYFYRCPCCDEDVPSDESCWKLREDGEVCILCFKSKRKLPQLEGLTVSLPMNGGLQTQWS